MADDLTTKGVIHKAVAACLERHAGRILVGVSGGVDSLALFLAAADLAPERVGVGSVDHGLRPGSAAEVEWVRSLAASRGLPFHTAKLGLEPGPGMEARARHARYEALERIARTEGYAAIATAHTADDQAETVLMRLARGSGLRGAGAIQASRGLYLRPLLEVRRADTEQLVASAGLAPVRDPTNADLRLFRARVRSGVIPALEEAAGPEAVSRLAAFARMAQEDEAYLSELAERALRRVGEGTGLDAVGVRALRGPIRVRVLRQWLEQAGFAVSELLLRQVEAAVERGGRTALPGRALLRSEGGWVRITRPGPGASGRVTLEPGTAVVYGPFRLSLGEGPGFPLGAGSSPFAVRSRRPGDRVGVADGPSRRVHDVLLDAAVPAETRDRWPLVVDSEDRVLWVVGLWPRPHPGPGPWVRAERLAGVTGNPAL